MKPRLIRWKEVQHVTGLTRRTADRMTERGDFPSPRQQPGYKWVAWVEAEVLEWVEARIKTAA